MTKDEAMELANKFIQGEIPVSVVGRDLRNDSDIELFHDCYIMLLSKTTMKRNKLKDILVTLLRNQEVILSTLSDMGGEPLRQENRDNLMQLSTEVGELADELLESENIML